MKVLPLTLGPMATNCYLVWQEGRRPGLVIDCAGDPRDILEAADRHDLEISLIVATHGHIDHIECLAELKRITGAEVACHELDAPMLSDPALSGAAVFGYRQGRAAPDRLLQEGDVVSVDGTDVRLSVLHTPGHSPGSISLLGQEAVFSGDCLFAGGIGRVDLPGGDERTMMQSLTRLVELDPDLRVYAGHGPATTIGDERENNPWLGHL
jgi:hydroxyacylglutathione hydrolase